MPDDRNYKWCVGVAAAIVLFGAAFFLLGPVGNSHASQKPFIVNQGDGFRAVADRLGALGIVRSSFVAKLYMMVSGAAGRLKPGAYLLSSNYSTPKIVSLLASGQQEEVVVTVPEGYSLYDIDRLLSDRGVILRGSLIAFAAQSTSTLEGTLFPDTYRFFTNSVAGDIARKMQATFKEKAMPLLEKNPKKIHETLVIASLLENEVPLFEDRRIVAGIILKRLASRMPLQLDATICYLKKMATAGAGDCTPFSPLDFQKDSPYNSYLYKGLPPGPIGNPGASAIQAALLPKASPYWFYLSDPLTKKTIFSQTLDTHSENRVKYLKTP